MQEQVDGRIASELAFNAKNRQNAIAHHSLEPPPRNITAPKIEQVLGDPVPYEEIVFVMQDQASRIRELEQYL